MGPQDVRPGRIYVNRGAGTSFRRVLRVEQDCRPEIWRGAGEPPEGPGVEFVGYRWLGTRLISDAQPQRLHLRSFVAWAGADVTDEQLKLIDWRAGGRLP